MQNLSSLTKLWILINIWPLAAPREPTMPSHFSRMRSLFSVLLFAAAITISATGQTFKLLATFNDIHGEFPTTRMVQGFNGNLYGTTLGTNSSGSYGTVFEVTTGGKLSLLYTFCSQTNCVDGKGPMGGLMMASNLNFYGTTSSGGAYGHGIVFKMTSTGQMKTLHNFCSKTNCADGEGPTATLVQGVNGDLYGTTSGGGANGNYGTVFEITIAGKLTTLYSFCSVSGCDDGVNPQGGLILGTDGNFYGTTYGNSASQRGSIFRITPAGELTTLYTFCSQIECDDGTSPMADLVQDANGNFYGTASAGGLYGDDGTVFELSSTGVFTDLVQFSGACCGKFPFGGLVQGTDGNFYGTTYYGTNGGFYGYGTAYEVTSGGEYNLLYRFCSEDNCDDGDLPYAGLMQATDGVFYGTAESGGKMYGAGTVFSLSLNLAPFVTTLPTSGAIGSTVTILGTNLVGTTAVSFNGVSATFTVASASEIKTTVPAGATTGDIQVTTPAGKLTSNLVFSVP